MDDVGILATGTDCDDPRVATGELKLIAAVLEQAIDDARRGDPEAIEWLADDDEVSPDGWTLVTICRHLGCDPGWVRSLVAEHVAAHPYVRPPTREPSTATVAQAA